jgi:1,4-dihydroxy-2-naphthoyl-CoA hydrolase
MPARSLPAAVRPVARSAGRDPIAFRAVAESIRDDLQGRMAGTLPGWFGLDLQRVEPGLVAARLTIVPEHLAPNGYLHAGTVVTVADSCCGMGCLASLPEGVGGFTTVELKTNFLRSANAGGGLSCRATLVHGGRTTQVWDAEVEREDDGKPLALFRCTQYLLAEARGRQDRPR